MLRFALITMATLAVASVHGTGLSCNPGWTLYDNSCYRLFSSGKSWQESRKFCLGKEAHLATIMNSKTTDFIMRHYLSWQSGRNNVWIGLNDLVENRRFEWVDTTLLASYTNWYPGEPKGSNGCTYIWGDHDYKWDEGSCHSKFHFLCEKSAFETCNKVLTDDAGLILSPHYPLPYIQNHNCRWTIQVANGNTIKLVFYQPFELEGGSCSYDYVKVTDVSPNGQRTVLGTWCGKNIPPVLTSTHSKMELEFKTDGSVLKTGFSASWQTIGLSCGGKFFSKAGFLTSPGFPTQYPGKQLCRWEIESPGGAVVTLRFGELFDLEESSDCAWDYVEVLRGDTTVGKWCGNSAPPTVSSNGQKLVVVFKSDGSNGGKGFTAYWDV